MSDCRWIPSTATPSGSLNEDGTINEAAFTSDPDSMALLIGQENVDKIGPAAILDIVNKGEDSADAYAIVSSAKISIILDNGNGKWYAAVVNSGEYGAYVGLFELKCGLALNLPWMLLGGALLGFLGLAVGGRFGSDKAKKRNAVIGAVAGSATGAVAGVLLAKLATPSYMKSAGLGAVVRRRRFR
jgi:hypothetical protein